MTERQPGDLISVIVATFNREDALDAVLRSLARQTDRNFEVLVADDGSGQDTRNVVAEWSARMPVALRHIWQEDRGFRLAEIRNRAIQASAGDYFIFLDGDCVARRDFVAAHRRLAQAGWFVAGNRVLLSPQLTYTILVNAHEPETWGLRRLARERMRGGVNRLLPVFSLPLGGLRRVTADDWIGARGANLAVARADVEKVDGFDASFGSWGLEDSDFVIRLLHAGVRRKDGRFATGVFHLWHPEADRSGLMDNQRRLDDLLNSDRVRAQRGLSHLAAEPAADAAGLSGPAGADGCAGLPGAAEATR
jgi:glycosyltransferase involved in cell wall biosynthesis